MNKKRHFLEPPEVKDYLVKGERFTKWSEDSTKTVPVTMKMDPKGFYVYWINQSKETTFLDVASIRDTRTGKYAKLPKHPKVRNVFNLDFPDSNHLAKTFTIVSGPDTVNLTYHNFFASKEKVTQNWANDILAIAYNAARNNACRQVFLEKIYMRLSLHTNKDGKIPVKNIYKMFPADKKRVESALASAHLPKGKYDTIKPDVFTETAFKAFLSNLCPRPEIYEIFTSYSNKPTMTKENFTKFLNEKQRDSRLNEELFPRLRQDQIKALIDKYEPCSSNLNRSLISPEGLLFFLMGPETSVVMQDRLAKCDDMSQPIPHYFVKSSHNTYLTAGQFSGVSSPEMYRQCLLSGCRCLELDCWKGKPPDEEPIITHGFTMTTEILFKDVIEAIAESAFKTSQYPIILSFENHVDSVKQQEKMANYCKTIFGDALLTEPLDKYPLKPGQQIPSPSELMGKILIKNKKGSHEKPTQTKKAVTAATEQTTTTTTAAPAPDPNTPAQDPANPTPSPQENQEGEAAVEDNEEQEETDEQDEEKMKTSDEGTAGQEVTAYEAMSSLVNYIQPNKFISFDNARKKNKSYVISSFVETKGEAMIAKTAIEFVEYNKRQMSRIYPKGTRMDSSNYSPQPFWNVGCQMVALNYQTMDFPMQLNMALFEFNGRTGYLLKHDVLRRSDKKFDPFCDRIDTVVASTLTIKIYSGQFLSEKNVKTGVEVEVIGLPGDPKKKYRTKWSTTPNAINPVWNEEPFVFEKILLPEMASLRIVVHEENGKFLGHRIIPLDAIQSGFHHICLRSESNMPLTLPALFVYIEVKDYIPAAFADFTDALFNPTKGTEKTTKTPKESSSDYISPYELPLVAQTPMDKAKENEAPAAEAAATEPTPPVETKDETSQSPPEANAEEAKEEAENKTDTPQPEAEPPEALSATPAEDTAPDAGSTTSETLPEAIIHPEEAATEQATPEKEVVSEAEAAPESKEEPVNDSTTNPEPASDDKPGTEAVSAAEEPAAAVVPCLASTSPESAGPDDSSQPPTCSEEPSTVTTEELTQHKNYLKVIKRQEKEMKETEKKYQKKGEDLIQKYSDSFKALKKKTSVKKKDGGGNTPDSSVKMDRVKDQKEKMQVELHTLWTEQCDQLKKKKEQCATERLAKLLEMATERHASELKTLESETKENKKKTVSKRSSSEKAKLKKAMSTELLDETSQSDGASSDYSSQQEALMKKQAATLEEIKTLTNQLNQEALKEHEQKLRSLPAEVREAVNVCVGAHFPELVDQAGDKKVEGVGFYGDVFLG
ncbi:LOW QUALITY PROTEIN: 1-phosphatidylinositol 4,5-bisphosphate phosphodiesterase beta-2 [Dicentrarchus labrax]|uniref:LOW QUALITY PROTEIN: 1-phosphatidylinositol 4,5-bisphosphate phosphodiesterase beta-2 n=1 Tax=Dicentrarchus labrax TaxID=13489 RepID=UPI0021F55CE2|nr:LOW QUALITY PROTEIN: 1-phosphatidylinositol 4,5-bisphosphate phosphodiesterase beta-2 [Dicentrarchus labrax]